MSAATDLWSLVYSVGGLSTLGSTTLQPLGALPAPLRAAALGTLHRLSPDLLDVKTQDTSLLFAPGTFRRLVSWQPLIERPDEHRDRQARQAAYPSLRAFCDHHALQAPTEGPDEHYAERLFLEEAFLPTLGLGGLSFLTPREPFRDSAGRFRRIDFVLRGTQRYALEIEGRKYHDRAFLTSQRFDSEKARQRDLASAGYQYLPFSLADIQSGRARATLQDLAQHDAQLKPVWEARATSPETSPAEWAKLARYDGVVLDLPEAFQTYQRALLDLFSTWEETGVRQVTLVDRAPFLPTLPLALIDLMQVAERVAALYGKALRWPQVHLVVERPTDPELYQGILKEWLGSELNPKIAQPDALRAAFQLSFGGPVPADAVVFAARAEDGTKDGMGRTLTPHAVRESSERARGHFGLVPPLEAQPVQVDRELLDYFARRFFSVPELKPEQVKLVQRTLRQESGLGLLPTGFGKSLVFQLFAMLTPRTSLVISPLKALIRDQVHSLHRQGLISVEAITSNDSTAQKSEKLEGFRTHRYRMLYVSPERLQIKGFAEEIRASLGRTPIGALIIDEAHCVSEWGHDFRPAYLQIRRLREVLQAASGRPIPILGLTATASAPVRKDVLRVLGLAEGAVEQLASSDRANISLSVHPLSGRYEEKAELLAHVIKTVIPGALGIPLSQFLPTRPQNEYPHAGVVFAIYANTHGKTTFEEGVHAISKRLQDRLIHSPDLVAVHASTAPTSCPQCGSALWVNASEKELAAAGVTGRYGGQCLECQTVFSNRSVAYDRDWETKLLTRQDDFQASKFPLLVATKGYGMGIDKRNIRFVVHHALSSGLEGFYQEAGRAGRDGAHSHAALIYRPPAEECYQTHLRSYQEPPCVSEVGNLKFHKCPYGLKPLCDYGRQAHFVKGNYPGEEQDVEAAMDLLPQLATNAPIAVSGDEDIKATQMALFRLQQLGVVGDYTLEYRTRRQVQFDVQRLAWTSASVDDHLQRHLKGELGLTKPAISKVYQTVGLNEEALGAPDKVLRQALEILVHEVYVRIQRMRYRMLTNELDYARPPARGVQGKAVCRRVIIRSIFDSTDHLPDDYNCGFCDVCVPDLKFGRTSANVVPRDATLDDIGRQLPEVMRQFDPQTLTQLVELADQHGAVIGLGARASSQLEHDPSNLSALYLAGALRARQRDQRDTALQQLAIGFGEATRTGAGEGAQKLFYEAAKGVSPDQAFRWVAARGGSFDSRDGLKWLVKEAQQTFGESSGEVKALRSVEGLRDLRAKAPVLTDLQDSLDDLLGQLKESA